MFTKKLPIVVLLIVTCILFSSCSIDTNIIQSSNSAPVYSSHSQLNEDLCESVSISLARDPKNVDDLIESSDFIIVGVLQGIYKEYLDADNEPFTEFNVKIDKVLKGSYQDDVMRVYQNGSQDQLAQALAKQSDLPKLSNDLLEYDTLLQLPFGTKVLLFLEKGSHPKTDAGISYVPYGLYAGTFCVDDAGQIRSSVREKARSGLLQKGNTIDELETEISSLDKLESRIKELLK